MALNDWIGLAFYILDNIRGRMDPMVSHLYIHQRVQPFVLPLTKDEANQIYDINAYMSKNKDNMARVPDEVFKYYEEKLFQIECLFYDQYKREYIIYTNVDYTQKPLFPPWVEEPLQDLPDETEDERMAREYQRQKFYWVDFNRVAYRRRDEYGNYY